MSLLEEYRQTKEAHYHMSHDRYEDVFRDGLSMQWKRIKRNLMRFFPDKTDDEIVSMMRCGEEI